MKIVGIIPARLQSSRLPRKLLLKITGKPLIQYVWETACECPDLHDVVVATDSEEIADVVHSFGGRAEMTGHHNSGTNSACAPVVSLSKDLTISNTSTAASTPVID